MDRKEFERAKIIDVETIIEYSPGAVVSKTVTNRPEGTVTLFAFDKGQGLSQHTAPFDAQVHIIEGEATIVIDSKSYILHSGQMIVMPAGSPHSLDANEKFKMILTMIKSRPQEG